MLDVLTNLTYVNRLKQRLAHNHNLDLLDAMHFDYLDFGIGEPDADLFDRTEKLKLLL